MIVGKVYTMDQRQPVAEAVLIRGTRIACVGTMRQCNQEAKLETPRLSVGGGAVTPGFVDTYLRVLPLGRKLRVVDCASARSEEECVARVAERAARVPAGEWILGKGWNEARWPGGELPRERILSFQVPEHPVALEREGGGAVWINEKALSATGVDEYTPDPERGRITRYGDGRPSGVLQGEAVQLVREVVAEAGEQEQEASLEEALHELALYGLTEVHDVAVSPELAELYRRLAAADRLPIRVRLVLDGRAPEPALSEAIARWRATPRIGRLTVDAVALWADGGLADRGAALLEPYADAAVEGAGMSVAELKERIARVVAAGMQPVVHASGDRAVQRTVEAVRALPEEPGPKAAQVLLVAPALLAKGEGKNLRELGIGVAVLPHAGVAEVVVVRARLGEREPLAHPWKQIVRFSVPLALGSGYPDHPFDPRQLLRVAVERRAPGGSEPWTPEQALDADDALRALTAGGAYSGRNDARRGMIRVGYEADLALLGRDPLAVVPQRLPDVPVLGTIVDGRFVYRAEKGLLEAGKREAVSP